MSYKAYLPSTWVGVEEHLRKVTRTVNILIDAIDVRGEITLNAGSVVVQNEKIGDDAIAVLQPKDAGAAATNWYAVVGNKSVEFFYVSGAGGNFKYQIIL
jgi:hypothetical protein